MSNLVNISDQEQRLANRVDSGVTGSLAISTGTGGLAFANANEAMEFAKLMALSQVAVPKHLRANPGACLAVVIQAIEWRMSPYAVANKSYSVNDRLAYESQLVQAVILQRAPIKGRFRFSFSGDGANRRCKVEVTTTTGEVVDYETPRFADIPVKNSPLWKGDPDQQMTYYAGRALCRRHFPDVLLGVYTSDEIEDERGPDRARDITPPKVAANAPLGDRLVAIKDRLPSGGQMNADPETGEITNSDCGSQAEKDTDPNGEGGSSSSAGSVSAMTPRQEGRAAYHGGGEERDCPAYRNRADRDEWIAGFRAAADENNDSFPGDRA